MIFNLKDAKFFSHNSLSTSHYHLAKFVIKNEVRPETVLVATLFIKINLNCLHEYRIQ